MSESQLLPPTEQPRLPGMPPPSFFSEATDELEVKGEFTAERLFVQRPDTYRAVVVLLAQKMGVIRIGKLLSVSPNTVMAVRDREGVTIDTVKQRLADVAHNGALLASEAIFEALNTIAPNAHLLDVKQLKELAVVYGILVQNGQLLAGQPTARLELTEVQKPQHEDFNRYLATLPTAQVIDIAGADSTGLAGEKSGAKRAGDVSGCGGGEPSGAAASGAPGSAATDGQSIGKPSTS